MDHTTPVMSQPKQNKVAKQQSSNPKHKINKKADEDKKEGSAAVKTRKKSKLILRISFVSITAQESRPFQT